MGGAGGAVPSPVGPLTLHPHPAPGCLQDDVREAPVELYHRLKLYDDTGAANPKKPVVQARRCLIVVGGGGRGGVEGPHTPRSRWCR